MVNTLPSDRPIKIFVRKIHNFQVLQILFRVSFFLESIKSQKQKITTDTTTIIFCFILSNLLSGVYAIKRQKKNIQRVVIQ